MGNFAVAGLVTVIGESVRDECMRDGTDENDDADTGRSQSCPTSNARG